MTRSCHLAVQALRLGLNGALSGRVSAPYIYAMEKNPPAWLRPAIEYGPLGIFLVVYYKVDLIAATGWFMAATAVALAVSYIVERRRTDRAGGDRRHRHGVRWSHTASG